MATGVGAKATAAVAPVGDPATSLGAAFLDADGSVVRAEHEGCPIAAANFWDVATAGGRYALASLALGAGRAELRG